MYHNIFQGKEGRDYNFNFKDKGTNAPNDEKSDERQQGLN